MSTKEHFKKHINEGYTFKNDFIILGGAMIDEEPVEGALVKTLLKT